MQDNNIDMLQDTLRIIERGYYRKDGRRIKLKLSRKEMEHVQVLLPDEVRNICNRTDFEQIFDTGRCGHDCENMDSFALARKRYIDCSYMFDSKDAKEILVLNFANSINPGGGVRQGASAQEEDLCRKSSLLLSLESKAAVRYYDYNRSLHTYMGSDALLLTPKVEIIKDENGDLLEETAIVAVLTCAAPIITQGKVGINDNEYQNMIYNRIMGMLKCAAYFGYKNLVLGAWGCGAFGNDAHIISELFYKALKEMEFNGMHEKDFFYRVDFAVLDHTPNQYNFKEFYRSFAFDNFYRDENQREGDAVLKKVRETEGNLNRLRGCLFGGAVGDALGYPVKFLDEEEIFSRFGEKGIQEYQLDKTSGKALISDDTQMTLFTANGLLVGDTRGRMRGIQGWPRSYVSMAYQDWLQTQEISYSSYEERKKTPCDDINKCISWLSDVPQLYSQRAPEHTCLSALRRQKNGSSYVDDYIKQPQNDSKGCGSITRIAPLALNYHYDIHTLDYEGAEIAAITHGHSLGYMSAAVLTHIINRIVFPEKPQTLKEIVLEARDTIAEIFTGDKHLKELTDIIKLSIKLSENIENDLSNINQIGKGWSAEEALGIAIYCALRYQNDFSAGVIAAVNHKGDTDSTGAVTGNILGALLGYNAIEGKWKINLELADVIIEITDDLCHGCQMSEYSHYRDPDWIRKYMEMQWKDKQLEISPKTEFLMVKGDITKNQHVQAIVNAANTSLLGGSGVDGAIHRAAGPKLLAECRLLNGCKTGKAKITKGYNLPCEYVIHTPGPCWSGGSLREHELLASCYQSCLELAIENGIRSIAFPSISTGIYHFPVHEAAKIAINTAKNFVADHPGKLDVIKWVLFDDKTFEVYKNELEHGKCHK